MKLGKEDHDLLIALVGWFELLQRPWRLHDRSCWVALANEDLVVFGGEYDTAKHVTVAPTKLGLALGHRQRTKKPKERAHYHCERCGHDWKARASKTGRPKFCAKCHSIRWDVVE